MSGGKSIHDIERDSEKIEALLLGLGKTRYSVAANLTQSGVRGLRNRPLYCPVVTYLGKQGFEGQSDGQYFTSVDGAVAHLPLAVRNFVGDFDRGLFPSLDAKAPIKVA